MSILNPQQIQNSEFRDCKIRYLIAENKLLSTQSDTLSQVIKIYKKIIDITTNQDTTASEAQKNQSIQNLLKQSASLVNSCLENCQQIIQSQELFNQSDELFITPEFFSQLIFSYEKTIAELKEHIHHRQIILQELQIDKNHPLKRKVGQIESAGVVRAIQAYDIYPKLAQRCRNQIIELKMHKKKLQEKCMTKFYGEKAQETLQENKNYLNVEEEKTIKVGLSKDYTKKRSEDDNMSTFEKVILIYKKKKLFNQILERKVIDLKKRIKEKQVCNQLLKQKIQSDQWENFNKIRVTSNRNFCEENAAYLSILNESMKANNLDFSVDLSRILPTSIGKYKEEKQNKDFCLKKILED